MFRFEWTKKHTTILIYICLTMLVAIAVQFVLLFPETVIDIIGGFFGAIRPVIIGFAIAYLLFPICIFIEKKLLKFINRKTQHPRLTRAIAVTLTFLLAFSVISLFASIMIPQIKTSYLDLESKFGWYLGAAASKLEAMFADFSDVNALPTLSSVLDIDVVFDTLESVIDNLFGTIGNVADKVVTYSSKVVSIVAQTFVSIIFAVYFMLSKERLFGAISRFSRFALPHSLDKGARKWLDFTHHAFGSFISGKLLNALLITLLNFIVFGLCGIPYYPLIALITGITDMIPYFGPFIGAIPAAFIILIADPIKVIWFAVLVIVIQQLDGNFIGPKILGEKVGVDSLLIIVAITVSGGLFGIIGMFIGVPVFTVLYRMVKEFIENRLKKKNLPVETEEYYDGKAVQK